MFRQSLARVKSQADRTGRHWKMVTRILQIQTATMEALRAYMILRKSVVGNTLRYEVTIEILTSINAVAYMI